MKKIVWILFTFLCSIHIASGQHKIFYSQKDVEIFNDYIDKFQDKRLLPMNELIVETGKYFLGTPYVNFTLEARQPEELIINLRELDCVTFVENTIALARTLKSDSVTFTNYTRTLCNLRYRDGELIDFTSRLHYFSDWIWNNEQMGFVEDRTAEIGGDPYPIRVNLMSRYPKNYKQLVADPDLIPKIAGFEAEMNKRTMASVPRELADSMGDKLKDGYLIGTTTPGMMDVTHSGFIVHVDGVPHFMHASPKHKKVVITEGSFGEYLESVKSMTGFMAAEVLEPDSEELAELARIQALISQRQNDAMTPGASARPLQTLTPEKLSRRFSGPIKKPQPSIPR